MKNLLLASLLASCLAGCNSDSNDELECSPYPIATDISFANGKTFALETEEVLLL